MLDKALRELDRERMGLQNQEKKLIAEIKKMAKEGQLVGGRGLRRGEGRGAARRTLSPAQTPPARCAPAPHPRTSPLCLPPARPMWGPVV